MAADRKEATLLQSTSKLDHSPTPLEKKSPRFLKGLKVERVRRVELPTLCLASIRSSQLSYTRILKIFIRTHRDCQFKSATHGKHAPVEDEKTARDNLLPTIRRGPLQALKN